MRSSPPALPAPSAVVLCLAAGAFSSAILASSPCPAAQLVRCSPSRGSAPLPAGGPVACETGLILPLQPVAGALLGSSLALDTATIVGGSPDGGRAVAGEPGAPPSGAARVLERQDGKWREVAVLRAPESCATASSAFGAGVAIDGTTLVVAAPTDSEIAPTAGAVHVFVDSAGQWTQQAKLTAGDGAAEDLFGTVVASSGNTIAVGVPFHDDAGLSTGAVYVFVRNGATWTLQDKLTAADAGVENYFGAAVALDGNWLAVGAPGRLAFLGAVYLFERVGQAWLPRQTLGGTLPAGIAGGFGLTAALDGSALVVGAPLEGSAGAAYTFRLVGASWTNRAALHPTGLTPDAYYGAAVAIAGSRLLIGARNQGSAPGAAGLAIAYQWTGTTWAELTRLAPPGLAAEDHFGHAVAIAGDVALAAVISSNLAALDAGAVLAWDFSAGGPDTDGDGTGDACDNCRAASNPSQQDSDFDRIGDICDDCPEPFDTDGDGVPGCRDVCPTVPDPEQDDADGDGVGNACEITVELLLEDVASPGDVVASVPLFLSPNGACASAVQTEVSFDAMALSFLDVVGVRSGCAVEVPLQCPGRVRLRFDCPAGVSDDGELATLRFDAAASGTASDLLALECSGTLAWDCSAEPGHLAGSCRDGTLGIPCVPGDVFPDGTGDGRVDLSDFALGHAKARGGVARNGRDTSCGDIDPATLSCPRDGEASSICRAKDAAFGSADVARLRSLVAGLARMSCIPCVEEAPDPVDLFLPGDVAPRGVGNNAIDISDVVLLLRWSVGLDPPDAGEIFRGDISPAMDSLAGSVVTGDEVIGIADVVLALRASVQLENVVWPERGVAVRLAASTTFSASQVMVDGWPAWARHSGLLPAACADAFGGGFDAKGDSRVATCATEPATRSGPTDVATFLYRGPQAVELGSLTVTGDLVDAAFGPVAAELILEPR